jgi:hypothetical protein
MTDPLSPNFKKGVGRLAVDRFDFQDHVDGYRFRHHADAVDLFPTVVINGDGYSNVQDAIEALTNFVSPPAIIVNDATPFVKGITKLAGDIGGTANSVTVTGLQNRMVSSLPPVDQQVLAWNAGTNNWKPTTLSSTFLAAGDISGNNISQTVIGIQGRSVQNIAPTNNQALIWNTSNTRWQPTTFMPTGTGLVTTTSGVIDTASTANVRYTGGKLQTDSNFQFNNAGITGDLSWAPTSTNKTLTLPNITDTVVARTTTDTLTNKTINATNNTITDTSATTGDILAVISGGKFTRLAKGVNGSFLGVSAGVLGYYTPSSSTPTGTGFAHITSGVYDPTATANIRYTSGKFQTDNSIQYKAGAITGDLAWTPTASNKVLTLPDITDTLVSRTSTDTLTNKTINATNNTITDTSTAAGDLLKSNGTKFTKFARGSALQVLRVNSGGTDLEWAAVSSGASSSGAAGVVQASNGSGGFQTTNIIDNGANIKMALPVAGNLSSSLPFRFKVARVTLAGELSYVLTASQYECPIIIVSGVTQGGSSYLEIPLSDGGYFCVHNRTDGAIDIRPAGGGSSLDISVTNKSAIAWYNSAQNAVQGVVSSVLS